MSDAELIRQLRYEADTNAAEVRRLTRERDHARSELKEARADLQRLNDEIVRHCRERDMFGKQRDEAERERDHLQKRCEKAEVNLTIADTIIINLKRERDILSEDYKELSLYVDDLVRERDEAQRALSLIQVDFATFNKARQALHEIVTNGAWISAQWCVSRAVYDLAYEADLRASTGKG